MDLRRFCKQWERARLRRAFVVVMGLVVLVLVACGIERALRGSSEFRGFRRIVQVSVVQDRNHYEHIGHVRAYGPFFPIAWAPFGLFPLGELPDRENALVGTCLWQQVQFGASAGVLLLVMSALTVWSARWVAEACGVQERRSCLAALTWVLAGGLMFNSIVRCETDMFVVGLAAGGMVLLLERGRPWSGGFLWGIAAAFKLTPALFGVYVLCRRKWAALSGMAVGVAVCCVFMPALVWGPAGAVDRYRSWFRRVLIPYGARGPERFIGRAYRPANQSLTAAAMRYLTPYNVGDRDEERSVNVASLSMDRARQVASFLKAGVLLLLVAPWLLFSRRADREAELLLLALVPPGMLLLSDVSVGGHLAIMAVPAGVLASFCLRRADRPVGRRVTALMLLAVLLLLLISVPRLKELSVATLGVMLTMGLLLYLVFSGHVCRRDAPAG